MIIMNIGGDSIMRKSGPNTTPTLADVMTRLKKAGSKSVVQGRSRYGIKAGATYGVSAPKLHALAKVIGRNHRLAGQLWKTGIHDARLLAGLIDDPSQVTEAQMERWVRQFRSWDVCDNCCGVLFDKTTIARKKAMAWSRADAEYIKRAGFAMMAALAVHDKSAPDDEYLPFLERIKEAADDDRNFVRKAVNWALRQIGKRNIRLNARALEVASALTSAESSTARWVGADALRELRSDAVQHRLRKKETTPRLKSLLAKINDGDAKGL